MDVITDFLCAILLNSVNKINIFKNFKILIYLLFSSIIKEILAISFDFVFSNWRGKTAFNGIIAKKLLPTPVGSGFFIQGIVIF